MVRDRLFGQTETAIKWRGGNIVDQNKREERVDRASCYDNRDASLLLGAGVRFNQFLDDHILFVTIASGYRAPVDRGAECLLP